MPPQPGVPPRRILVVTAAGLGDFILGTPAIRAIRGAFPGALVWALTIPEVAPLAERCPDLDSVRCLDLRGSRSALQWAIGRRRGELLCLLRDLRSQRFDLAVNLAGVGTLSGWIRTAVFLRLVGAGQHTGRRWRTSLPPDQEGLGTIHELDAQIAAARDAGAETADRFPRLWVTAEDRDACRRLLEDLGLSGKDPLACLLPGSAQLDKRWPASRFAELGRRLSKAGAQVVLAGAPDERPLCDALLAEIPGAWSAAGRTSIPILAALLERAAVAVTNDSGPMHVAAALGTPLVVPFGPGSPARFGPRGRGPIVVLAAAERPGTAPWWQQVAVEQVASEAMRMLRAPQGAPEQVP